MDKQRAVITSAVLGGGALVLLLAAGCSSTPATEYARVTGHVSYHGKPILIGTITVFNDAGAFASAPIDDGQYELSRAPVGTVHVVLRGRTDRPDPKELEASKWAHIRESQERMKKWEAEGKKLEDLPAEPVRENPKMIPSKYNGDRTTPLTHELKPGGQVFNIDIDN
jgi:hypothetical protein